MFVAIDGIDAAGKDTLIRYLRRDLRNPVVVRCPEPKVATGSLLTRLLTGTVVLPRMAEIAMFEANRWEVNQTVVAALKGGKDVLANRWTPSGLAYALASGRPYMDAVLAMSKGLAIPDITIVLDVPVNESFNRRTDRDRFESNRRFLSKARRNLLQLSEEMHWHVIDGRGEPVDVYGRVRRLVQTARGQATL